MLSYTVVCNGREATGVVDRIFGLKPLSKWQMAGRAVKMRLKNRELEEMGILKEAREIRKKLRS